MISKGARLFSYLSLSLLPLLIYTLFLGGATAFVATHPKHGWDMLGYIGVIESWHTSESKALLNTAYLAIRGVPEYEELVGISACQSDAYKSYRADLAHNQNHFVQQLRFYSIKPLYAVFVSALHRTGLNYPKSFALVSVISYFGLGVLTWIWLSRYWSRWMVTIFASLLMLNPEIISLGRFTSPDALALVLFGIGLYALAESPRFVWGPLLLLVLIWVRPDALILVGLLLLTSAFLRATPNSVSKRSGWFDKLDLRDRMANNWSWLFLLALGFLIYVTIEFVARPYPWSTLFFHSFVNYLVRPAETSVHITPRMFLHTVLVSSRNLLGNSEIALLLVMGTLAIVLSTVRHYRYFTIAVLVSVLLHFLFYPSDEFRFHAPATFFVPISLLIVCALSGPPRDAWHVGSEQA